MVLRTLNSIVEGWVSEHRFAKDRGWRFDYAHPVLKIAIEIEGGIWIRGRHTRGLGYLRDMEKYNNATLLGWAVLRYTPNQKGNMVKDVVELLKRRGVFVHENIQSGKA